MLTVTKGESPAHGSSIHHIRTTYYLHARFCYAIYNCRYCGSEQPPEAYQNDTKGHSAARIYRHHPIQNHSIPSSLPIYAI